MNTKLTNITKITNTKEGKMSKSLEQKEDKIKEEIWRDIKGYEGLYQVSNKGRIKSLKRIINGRNGLKRHIKERILSPCADQSGYLLVKLSDSSGKHA